MMDDMSVFLCKIWWGREQGASPSITKMLGMDLCHLPTEEPRNSGMGRESYSFEAIFSGSINPASVTSVTQPLPFGILRFVIELHVD